MSPSSGRAGRPLVSERAPLSRPTACSWTPGDGGRRAWLPGIRRRAAAERPACAIQVCATIPPQLNGTCAGGAPGAERGRAAVTAPVRSARATWFRPLRSSRGAAGPTGGVCADTPLTSGPGWWCAPREDGGSHEGTLTFPHCRQLKWPHPVGYCSLIRSIVLTASVDGPLLSGVHLRPPGAFRAVPRRGPSDATMAHPPGGEPAVPRIGHAQRRRPSCGRDRLGVFGQPVARHLQRGQHLSRRRHPVRDGAVGPCRLHSPTRR